MDIQVLKIGALALTLLFFGILYFLGKKKNVDFGILTLLATAFGIIVGLVFKENFEYVAVFGTIFTNIISAMVVPLLLFSIISSITNLGESVHLKKIGFKSVFFLLLNNLTASVITLIAAVALQVGKGFPYQTVTDYQAAEVPTFIDTIVSLFPQNLITQWGEGKVVPIVIFAILIAAAYNQFGKDKEDVKPFKTFIDAGNKVLGQAIGWIMDRKSGRKNRNNRFASTDGSYDISISIMRNSAVWSGEPADPFCRKTKSCHFLKENCSGRSRRVYLAKQRRNNSGYRKAVGKGAWSRWRYRSLHGGSGRKSRNAGMRRYVAGAFGSVFCQCART